MAPAPYAMSRSNLDLANDASIFEDSSGSESSYVDANIRRKDIKKKNRSNKRKKSRSKPEPTATTNAPNKTKIIRAIEGAAAHLANIGNEEDVADWLDDNGFTDQEELQTLRRACTAISTLLRAKASPISAESEASAKELDQYYVFRSGSRSVKLLSPIESLRCNSYYTRRKVLGFLRRKGEMFPLMMALPGWTPCADPHPKLLDSEIWCEYVLQVAANLDHHFQSGSFDRVHNKRDGTTYASHVEPKLVLWFACYLLTKRMGEKLNLRKLWLLRRLETRIEAEIIISEEPCHSCKKFTEVIELVTGLKFTFKVCTNLGTLKHYRNIHGQKQYPLFASDGEDSAEMPEMPETPEVPEIEKHTDLQSEGEDRHVYPLQPRTSNVMVVIKPYPRSSSNSRNTTEVQISHTQLTSFAKHHRAVSKPAQPRTKRQYDDSDDNEEWQPPRARHQAECAFRPASRKKSDIRSGSGLISPTPSPNHRQHHGGSKKYIRVEQDPTENGPSYSQGTYGGKRMRWE